MDSPELNQKIVAQIEVISEGKDVEDVKRLVLEADPAILDPLLLLPALLSSSFEDLDELSIHIATDCSGKEVILALGEYLEIFRAQLESLHADGKDEDAVKQASKCPLILSIFTLAIPRIPTKRRLPSQSLGSILSDLEALVDQCAPLVSRPIGLNIIRSTSRLAKDIISWVEEGAKREPTDVDASKELLRAFLKAVVEACQSHIQTSLSIRVFSTLQPRLARRMRLSDTWKDGDMAIASVIESLSALSPPGSPDPAIGIGWLILTAHTSFTSPHPPATLTKSLPMISASIQQNNAIDSSLALLQLLVSRESNARSTIPDTLSSQLFELLVPLASIHLDADIRFISFRLISTLISCSSPGLQVTTLRELVAEAPFPQMRVAAITLLREVILAQLRSPQPSFFTSSDFIRSFGPVIFRPQPPELFEDEDKFDRQKFLESLEPSRLIEALSLYYVVLMNDKTNRTSMNSSDTAKAIDYNILRHLRRLLDSCNHGDHDHDHDEATVLTALRAVINRVDEARSSIVTA